MVKYFIVLIKNATKHFCVLQKYFDIINIIKRFLQYWSTKVIGSILDKNDEMFHHLYEDRFVAFSKAEIQKANAKGTTLVEKLKKKYCSISSNGALSVPFYVSIKLSGFY